MVGKKLEFLGLLVARTHSALVRYFCTGNLCTLHILHDLLKLQDFEREMIEEKKRQEEEGKRGAWNEVEIGEYHIHICLPVHVCVFE